MTWNYTNTPGIIFIGDMKYCPDSLNPEKGLFLPLEGEFDEPDTPQQIMKRQAWQAWQAYCWKSPYEQTAEVTALLNHRVNCAHNNYTMIDDFQMVMGSEGVEETGGYKYTCEDCGQVGRE